jgi:dockerin type I repeat protein
MRQNPRFLFGLVLCLELSSGSPALAQAPQENSGIQFGRSYHNDVSPALRDLAAFRPPTRLKQGEEKESREANLNPRLPLPLHIDAPDPVVDHGLLGLLIPDAMPATILNFDGIPFPGVACNCAPPDANDAVGLNQYVQMVNEGYQVFNKTSGSSVLGPIAISTIWSGFGGVCQTDGRGSPVVLYDHLANRWVISQIAGAAAPTDQCIAISTTSDAAGSYFRYGFHLGANAFNYPHLGVWPNGYYMAVDVFNSGGTTALGPQAFAFDRAKMLAGMAATFVTPGITGGASEPPFLPSDLDGTILPAAGTGNPFVSFPGSGTYKVRLFHADFAMPANTTFHLVGSPAAAGFTELCPSTLACVPQSGTTWTLDGVGDHLMFRLAYRKFGDGHEAVVGNYTVNAGTVAGVRWFELRAVTTTPTVFQESTYQPDATWRWMGSAAMDQTGALAVGFSASSASIHPQIRYAGRLVNDPINTLGRGEATLIAGPGSQIGNDNRWGAYSSMSVDPVDDCTFWYTQEYFLTTGNSWRTRIGSFKFATCPPGPPPIPTQVVSRKLHSGTPYDINLPLTGNSGIECRGGGPNKDYQVVFAFARAVTFNNASVTSGTGGVSSSSGSGTSIITANLTGVTSVQTITITLSGVSDGSSTIDVMVPMGVLVGDATGNGAVNASDVSLVKLQSGQALSNSNFRSDITASGSINASDVSNVKSKSGTALP